MPHRRKTSKKCITFVCKQWGLKVTLPKPMDVANPTMHGMCQALRNVDGQLKWVMPTVNGNGQWQWASLTGHGRHWCVGSGQCQGLLMRRYLSGHLHAGTHNDKLEFSPLNTLIVTHWTKENVGGISLVLHLNLTAATCCWKTLACCGCWPSPLVHDLFLQTSLYPQVYSHSDKL